MGWHKGKAIDRKRWRKVRLDHTLNAANWRYNLCRGVWQRRDAGMRSYPATVSTIGERFYDHR